MVPFFKSKINLFGTTESLFFVLAASNYSVSKKQVTKFEHFPYFAVSKLIVMPADSSRHSFSVADNISHSYDAIVIGSGISGGWAAKELCEKGLKTLVIERGRNVTHLKDYPTATKAPWEFPHREQAPLSITKENPIVNRCYAFSEASQHFFVKDTEHPYIQEKPYDWIRGY